MDTVPARGPGYSAPVGANAPQPAVLSNSLLSSVPGVPPSPAGVHTAPIPGARPAVSLQKPDGPALRGQVQIHASVGPLAARQQVTLKLDNQTVTTGKSAAAFQLDTLQFPDGPHDLTAEVEEDGAPVSWDRQRILIDNTPPQVIRSEQVEVAAAGDPVPFRVALLDEGSGAGTAVLHLPDRAVPLQPGSDGTYTAAVAGLTAETPYWLELTDRAGNRTTWPEQGSASLTVFPLTPPESLDATAGDGGVQLTWAPSVLPPGAAYVVYRDGQMLGTTQDPAYTDAYGLQAGAAYTYTVALRSASGANGAASPAATVRLPDAETVTREVAAPAAGPTSVGGAITADTTWGVANSPYLITSSVTVNSGVTLTVEPGTIVKFAAGTNLKISGTLNAQGLADSRISFTSAKDDANGGDTNGDGTATAPAAGDWYAVEAGSGGTVNLAQADVLYAGKSNAAVYSSGGTVNASQITVRFSATRGIQLVGGSVTGSALSDVATTGIYVNGGAPTIDGNSISGGNYSVSVYAGAPSITNNTLSGSSAAGIYLANSGADVAGTLTGNSITGSKGYAVDLVPSSRTIGNLVVGSNSYSGNVYNGYGLAGSFGGTSTLKLLDYPYVPHGFTVNAGATLNVPAGAVFKPASGNTMAVAGTLNLTGTADSPIIFTSVKDDTVFGDTNGDGTATVPAAGDWYYIDVRSGGLLTASQAQFTYGGKNAPTLYSSGGTIQADGITVSNSSGRAVQISGTGYLRNSTLTANASGGVYVSGGSPTISGNLISGGSQGIYVNAGAPVITGNQISGSTSAGVYYYGTAADLTGTLSGNTITGSRGYAVDLYLSAHTPGSLAASGNSFSGNAYNGYGLSGSFGGTYTMPVWDYPFLPHGVSVPSTASLTVSAGTVFKVVSGSITNNGTLTLNGTTDAPIVFTSVKDDTVQGDTNSDGSTTAPAAGNWDALVLASGTVNANNVTLRYGGSSYIQVDHRGGTANLNGLFVADGKESAVALTTGGTLTNSTVRSPVYGVRVKSGSPVITGNDISGTNSGVYMEQGTPKVRNNTISGGGKGIYLYGYSTLAQPEITGNTISGTTAGGVYIYLRNMTGSGITLTGNTFTGNTYPIAIQFDGAGWGSNTISDNAFSGNTYNGYSLKGSVGISSAFYPMEQPYLIAGQFNVGYMNGTATASFNPGTVVKFIAGGSLVVWDYADLELRGTADQKVVFTSIKDDSVGGDTNSDGNATAPAAGDWQDVTYYGKGTIDNSRLLYGGSKTYQYPILYLSGGTVQLLNSEIGYSGYDGLWDINEGATGSVIANSTVHDAPHYGIGLQQIYKMQISNTTAYGNGDGLYTIYASPYVEASTFRNNAYGIYNMSDPGKPYPTIRLSNIINNGTGVYNWTMGDPVDARFNWWGSDAGPGANGTNGLNGRVAVGPWIGREYQDARQFGSAWWSGYVNSVNMVTGDWSRTVSDLQVNGGKGFGIQISRTYHSLGWTNSSFGQLWTFNYDLGVKDEPDQNRVTVTYGSGQQARFTVNADGSYSAPAGDRNTLVRTGDGGWELTTKDHSTFRFDSQGRALTASDRNGNTTTFSAGADGKIATVTDAGGRQVSFERDGSGRITRITDPAGHAMTYTYDGAGNLASFTDVLGQTTTYAYNADHRLTAITRPDGVVETRVEYDSETRVSAVYDALGNKTAYGYNVANRSNTVTDPLGYTTRYVYDADFRLLSATDPLGYTTTTSYDANDNVISVQDNAGGITTYSYDSHNNKTSETDPLGNVSRFTYDANDDLTKLTDPLGNAVTYTYDARHNRISQTDPLGRVTRYAYDDSGLMTAATDPLGNVTTFAYDTYGNNTLVTDPLQQQTASTYDVRGLLLTLTDPLGNSTTKTYDAAGRLLTVTDQLGGVTSYTYDTVGRPTGTTDPEGRTTTTAYDAAGHATGQTDALGQTKSYTYDAVGNPVTVTDELGNVTRSTHDARGALASTADQLGNVVSYTYDANGNRSTITDPNGNVTRFSYDKANRLVQVRDHDGVVLETTEYDAAGRTTAKTDGNGRTVRWTYDAAGQTAKVTDPLGNVSAYTYDAAGRVTATADALNQSTTAQYDALGRLTAVTLSGGETYQYTYDALSRRTGTTDPLGHTETTEYDALGRMTRSTDASGVAATYTYDRVGNLLTAVDRSGNTVSHTYDAANRLTNVNAPGGIAISYGYDAGGRRTSMTDPLGTTTYTYDAAGRPTKVTAPDQRSATYAYDAAGNAVGITDYAGQVTTRTYDRRNRLVSVTAPDGAVTQYTYDNDDLLLATAYPNGVKIEAGYDGANRLTSVVNRRPDGSAIASFAYTYDALGRQTSVQDDTGLTSYAYDADNRLTLVTEPDGGTTRYGFDGAGNRVSKAATPAGGTVSTTGYTYDSVNRLTQVTNPDGNVISYAYDANGNLTGDGARTYAYDSLNRLVSVMQGSDTAATYAYNGDGQRVQKTVGAQTTRYYYAGQDVLNEGDGTAITASNIWGDNLIRRDAAGQAGYYLFNGHRDVVGLVDTSGSSLASYRYDVYGAAVQQSGSFANPYRYGTEAYDDETGFIYLRARYYNPALGRFLSQDTVAGDPNQPWSFNQYAYAWNNPLTYSDPSGHWPEWLDKGWSKLTNSTGFKVAMSGLEAVGGFAEANIGAGLCATGVGCAIGAPMVVDGAAHMAAGILDLGDLAFNGGKDYGKHNVLRNLAEKINPEHGAAAYDLLSAGLNLAGGVAAFKQSTSMLASGESLMENGAAKTTQAASLQARQQAMLDGAPGYNLTPRSVALRYSRIGRNGTFLTDRQAFEAVIGPIPSNVSRMAITPQQARALEQAMGLTANSVERINILSIVEDVAGRFPRSPFGNGIGNKLFLGGGKGLPGGGPELLVNQIPSAGGPGIRQVILEVTK